MLYQKCLIPLIVDFSDLLASPEVSLPKLSQGELAGTPLNIKLLNNTFKQPTQASYLQSSAKQGAPLQNTVGGPGQAPHQHIQGLLHPVDQRPKIPKKNGDVVEIWETPQFWDLYHSPPSPPPSGAVNQ